MEVGCTTTGVKTKRIRIAGKNRFTALKIILVLFIVSRATV
jgi:hypothetical protein